MLGLWPGNFLPDCTRSLKLAAVAQPWAVCVLSYSIYVNMHKPFPSWLLDLVTSPHCSPESCKESEIAFHGQTSHASFSNTNNLPLQNKLVENDPT